jgi:hypothetical protein
MMIIFFWVMAKTEKNVNMIMSLCEFHITGSFFTLWFPELRRVIVWLCRPTNIWEERAASIFSVGVRRVRN